jgi:hypothetical protein
LEPLVSRAAKQHLEQTFLPAWRKLFLVEGTDAKYPMPAASDVRDLLPGLRGVRGIAVSTDPGTTVTEGQAYAMFVAGMQRDTETLKALTVAWQANGQAFGGQPACGGCCSAGGWEKPREVCAAAGANRGTRRRDAQQPATYAGLCGTVPGAYLPAWRMPPVDSGFLGSATDADQDAITGLIHLAHLTGETATRVYALKSIAAFVLEDLGLADPARNSRNVPTRGELPPELQTIWLWRCAGVPDERCRA